MKPLLLLIPGMFNTAAIWKPVVDALHGAADIRIANVLTQDSIAAMAKDAWAEVADRPGGAPLMVCGFSMGGYVALELLAAQRDAVSAIAFIDSGAGVESADSLVVRKKTITALERNFERTVEGVIGFSLYPDSLANTSLVNGMRSMMHSVGAAAAIRQTRAIMARGDHRAMLRQLAMPALVVCGRHDKVVPPALSEELAQLIPGARLEWIEHAGHQTPLEAPAMVARHLQTLISTLGTP
ncbi:MAG: alpha/beta fold hydrolase [Burkholderiaceae bacterium]